MYFTHLISSLVNVTNIARTILMCLNQCTLEDIYSNLMPLFHLLSIIFEKVCFID